MSEEHLKHIDGMSGARRHFRYFDYVMATFVAILLLSNLIGAAKLSTVAGFTFGAGILFFPVSYVIGDVLTEVYGYANARRCVWAGFVAMAFMAFMSWAVVAMPPNDGWWCAGADENGWLRQLLLHVAPQDLSRDVTNGQICQLTYESVFGSTWRIVLASMLAFWAGEFVNSFVLAKMKIWTEGKYLWTRTIGSTVFGQAVDSVIFYPVAFLGVWETSDVLLVMVTNWAMKVAWEAILTPVTYVAVNTLKAREGVDVFDENTDFSPFAKAESV